MLKRTGLLLFVLLLVGCDTSSSSTPSTTPNGTLVSTVTDSFITQTPIQEVTIVPDTATNIPPEEEQFQSTVTVDPSVTNSEMSGQEHASSSSDESEFLYAVQPGTPLSLPSPSHPDCNWMGVGGQAFDLEDQPAQDVIVQLGGTLNGIERSMVTMAGWASQWGPGGFEFELFDRPMPSQGTLWLQLYDADWQPISDRVYFDTYGECDKSFVMINFNQQRAAAQTHVLYFPLVSSAVGRK